MAELLETHACRGHASSLVGGCLAWGLSFLPPSCWKPFFPLASGQGGRLPPCMCLRHVQWALCEHGLPLKDGLLFRLDSQSLYDLIRKRGPSLPMLDNTRQVWGLSASGGWSRTPRLPLWVTRVSAGSVPRPSCPSVHVLRTATDLMN